MTDLRYTQFVLFKTPLPALGFMPVWTPFAHRYLSRGLHKISLYKRTGKSLLGDAPDFVSRNDWPAHAFELVLASGEIGEGGGGPIQATQGGTFAEEGPAALPDRGGLLIAFLKLRQGIVAPDALPLLQDACFFAHPAPGAPRRFDAVLLHPNDPADSQSAAAELLRSLRDGLDEHSSQIAEYRLAMELP